MMRAREAVFCEKVKKNEFAMIFSSVCPKKYLAHDIHKNYNFYAYSSRFTRIFSIFAPY